MKIGIKKIEFIDCSNTKNWGFLGRNASANISEFLNGPMLEQKFIQDTVNLEEEWLEDSGGLYSVVTTSASIRVNSESVKRQFMASFMGRIAFRVTTVDNWIYIIGSTDFPARLNLKWLTTGTSLVECQFTIYCKSLHGMIIDTSS